MPHSPLHLSNIWYIRELFTKNWIDEELSHLTHFEKHIQKYRNVGKNGELHFIKIIGSFLLFSIKVLQELRIFKPHQLMFKGSSLFCHIQLERNLLEQSVNQQDLASQYLAFKQEKFPQTFLKLAVSLSVCYSCWTDSLWFLQRYLILLVQI